MKKKILVFLCAFAVIFACFPITAFAQTLYPNFIKIGEEQGITVKNYWITEDENFYHVILGYGFYNKDKGGLFPYSTGTSNYTCRVYKVKKSNPYKTWEKENNSEGQGFGGYAYYYFEKMGQTMILGDQDLKYSDSADSEIFFKQTPLQTAIPLLTGVIKDMPLKNVLNELISVLPVLIPCVIALIAIRKGIKFTLATLRTA